jgi:hypothetical protein
MRKKKVDLIKTISITVEDSNENYELRIQSHDNNKYIRGTVTYRGQSHGISQDLPNTTENIGQMRLFSESIFSQIYQDINQ